MPYRATFCLFDHFSSVCDNPDNVVCFFIVNFQLFIYLRIEYNRLARACRHLHKYRIFVFPGVKGMPPYVLLVIAECVSDSFHCRGISNND